MALEALAEYGKLHRQWTVDVVNISLRHMPKYRPSIPFVYRTAGFRIGIPWTPGSFAPLIATYDIDRTATDMRREENFMENFAGELGAINGSFRKSYESGLIKKLIGQIYMSLGLPRNDPSYEQPQKRFAKALRDAQVTKDQIIEATPPAIERTPLAPRFTEAHQQAVEIGTLGTTCSANLDYPVEGFSEQKMGIPKILAVGAKTVFDESGLISDLTSNVGYQKFANMVNIARAFNNQAEMFCYIADTKLRKDKEPGMPEPEWPVFASCGIALGIGIKSEPYATLKHEWEKSKKEILQRLLDSLGRTFESSPETWIFNQIPGAEHQAITIASAAIRDDFTLWLLPYKAWLIKRLVTAFISPVEYAARVEDFYLAKLARKALYKQNPLTFDSARSEIVERIVRARTTFLPFYQDLATEIDQNLFALEREVGRGDKKNQIKIIDDIFDDMSPLMAEPHFEDADVKKIKEWSNIFEDWRKRFPNLRPGPNV
ncbi:MAG: hypothetical protein J4452_03955 [Candidatus Aenigmarchaeota archaeon]|nr:hypothetical protein [Candidatus Aenigmarchaeota archaeon]